MNTILVLTHVASRDALFSSYVYYHAMSLEKLGNKVIIFAVNNYFPFFRKKIKKQVEIVNNLEIHFLNRISFSNLFINSKINLNGLSYYCVANKEVKKVLKKDNINLIDAHYFKVEGYVAYRLKKKYNIKTFITLHGTSFNNSFNSVNGKKDIIKISNTIDYFVCVSEKLQRMLKKIKVNNSKVIYNGINFFKNNEMQKKINTIITIGSFTSDKNIDIVIEAFKKVLNTIPDLYLIIIGSGELENYLKELCLEINDKVLFTGQVSNNIVYEYLNNSNIFVLPSSPEGFGIVYVEAMYNKCITIGTKGEGIDGFIKNGENGFLVNIDVNEIANLIIDIMNNDKYDLEKIKNNAYRTASELTWERNAKEYVKLIERR